MFDHSYDCVGSTRNTYTTNVPSAPTNDTTDEKGSPRM